MEITHENATYLAVNAVVYLFSNIDFCLRFVMRCSSSYKIIPEQPDLHCMKLGLVLISISHVFLIVLVINTSERLIQ